jgi:hypothetical protein
MAEQSDHDGPANRSWWADALDPVENLRALADVQGFGRRAAEDLADRLLAGGAGHRGRDGDAGSPAADVNEMIRRLRADAVHASELSVNVIDHLAMLFSVVVSRLPPAPQPDRQAAAVVLPAVAPGAETGAVFWIHNTSAVPVASVRPHCAPPRSHLGHELPATCVRFDPAALEPLPPRSSCGVDVRLCVPAATPPGSYVSIIMVTNVPDLHLPLRVTVRPDEDAP